MPEQLYYGKPPCLPDSKRLYGLKFIRNGFTSNTWKRSAKSFTDRRLTTVRITSPTVLIPPVFMYPAWGCLLRLCLSQVAIRNGVINLFAVFFCFSCLSCSNFLCLYVLCPAQGQTEIARRAKRKVRACFVFCCLISQQVLGEGQKSASSSRAVQKEGLKANELKIFRIMNN